MQRTLALAVLLAVPLAGCVERKLMVRTSPEGARVSINGVPAGETPFETTFDHYGVVRMSVEPLDADGDGWAEYRRLTTAHELAAPWYQWFPFDFFADNLWPWTVVDRHHAFLVLQPALRPGNEDDEALMRKAADELRVRAERIRAEGEAGRGGAGEPEPAPGDGE